MRKTTVTRAIGTLGLLAAVGLVLAGRTASAEPPLLRPISAPPRNDQPPPPRQNVGTLLVPLARDGSGAAQPPAAGPSAMPLDLQTALEWTLSANPDLIAVRQNLCVSAEAVQVARRLPESLNPNVSVTVSPWVWEGVPGDGVQRLDSDVAVSLEQPIELGHRTRHRVSAARAAYRKEHWNIVQAELQAVAETYGLYQTAAYRREKVRVARELADFNDHLVATLRRQMEAAQVPAADVVLAEVEGQATQQDLAAARQEYAVAISELCRQMGVGDRRPLVPGGRVQLPEASAAQNEEGLIAAALASQPEIRAAEAQVANSRAALCLARADRIPVPSIGPYYERNETGASFYGMVVSGPVPVLNSGAAMVRQREAEYCRDKVALELLRQKIVLRIKDAEVKWRQSLELVARTQAIHRPIEAQAARMGHLYEAGQTDLVKLLEVRRRLIEAQNLELDVLWQATQAYADLLSAVGVTPLVDSLRPAPPQPGGAGK